MQVKRFSFKLKELPARLPYEVVAGTRTYWIPFAAESDPESRTVWIWARLDD